ncbi:MAG: transketolase [Acidimicrobiia bacterium]|nr:transketolase [Acidimicrobiia bacterium]
MTQATMTYTPEDMAEYARQARVRILEAVKHAGGGHVGGPYSAAEMLAALYFGVMNVRPEEPEWPDRDRFVLSKGHSSIALYTMLALRGFFPVEELLTFDAIDSRLQGHPDMTVTPGIDMSSGSLGLGFAGALGIALGGRAAGRDFTTYVMLGDGECNEGVVWEGAHVAARYKLDNIIAIIDHNKLQQFGWTGSSVEERITPYTESQLADRWRAFGWHTMEMDGHNIPEILSTLAAAKEVSGVPVAIVAHTVKGKGVSYMEGNYKWHSKVPTDEEFAQAMEELGEGGAE